MADGRRRGCFVEEDEQTAGICTGRESAAALGRDRSTKVVVDIYEASRLWSCAFINEHTTAAACLATPFAAMVAANAPGLHEFHRLHLLNVMSGRDLPYLDPEAQIFIGPFPWATLLAVALLGAALLTAGAALVQPRDF